MALSPQRGKQNTDRSAVVGSSVKIRRNLHYRYSRNTGRVAKVTNHFWEEKVQPFCRQERARLPFLPGCSCV